MNENQPTNDMPIDDAWGELLSAYHDGELSAAEQAEVEARLADDPMAQKWLAQLGSLRTHCQEAVANPQWNDFSKQVLAEAKRRKENAVDRRPLVASQAEALVTPQNEERPLEPEGDFGLPFGRSSRAWVWAGVAAAAAIMIGYVDRPAQNSAPLVAQRSAQPSLPNARTTPVAMGIDRMRQAVPGLRVVRIELSPENRKQFIESLARNGFGFESNAKNSMPQEFVAARRAGVQVEPLARGPEPNEQNDDQLMFVSTEAPRYSRLIRELENDKSIFRVEADPVGDVEESEPRVQQPFISKSPTQTDPAQTVKIPKQFRVIRFQMNVTPQIGAAPKLEITPTPAKSNTEIAKGSVKNKRVVGGEEEALPDAVANLSREATIRAQAKLELARAQAARRQSGRVPVVFVVKMRASQSASAGSSSAPATGSATGP